MRGVGGRRRGVRLATAAVILLAAAGCTGRPAVGPALPTFPAQQSAVANQGGPVDVGVVPDDCARLLTVSDLGALLGMPLDTVAVRTTIGVPAPSVGRTERLDCDYTGPGAAKGRPLLDLNAAAYSDMAAAEKQWRLNADVEDGDRRDVPIGAASAVLIERRGETVLTVVYGSGTLTFMLPARPLPGDRPPGDVLIDLALRVLPALAGAAPAVVAPPAPVPLTPDPSQAAGSVS